MTKTSFQPTAMCGRGRAVGGSRYLNFVRAACEVGPTLVMRGVSLVGVSQSEVCLTVTVTVTTMSVSHSVFRVGNTVDGAECCLSEKRTA